jgi:hypothetical protein
MHQREIYGVFESFREIICIETEAKLENNDDQVKHLDLCMMASAHSSSSLDPLQSPTRVKFGRSFLSTVGAHLGLAVDHQCDEMNGDVIF